MFFAEHKKNVFLSWIWRKVPLCSMNLVFSIILVFGFAGRQTIFLISKTNFHHISSTLWTEFLPQSYQNDPWGRGRPRLSLFLDRGEWSGTVRTLLTSLIQLQKFHTEMIDHFGEFHKFWGAKTEKRSFWWTIILVCSRTERQIFSRSNTILINLGLFSTTSSLFHVLFYFIVLRYCDLSQKCTENSKSSHFFKQNMKMHFWQFLAKRKTASE